MNPNRGISLPSYRYPRPSSGKGELSPPARHSRDLPPIASRSPRKGERKLRGGPFYKEFSCIIKI
uniref:Uncharacterized protein n=1 Tax=Triticum urartu TaxID=4572 RepID=A0A8R7P6R4_TRIUA